MFEGMDYVYAVYKMKSFSKAASALYISQPSLSIMVKKEEERLGFPIFDRSVMPIRLTDMGKEYIKTAEKLIEIKGGFENYLSELNDLVTGNLYIGSTNLFVSYALPPLLSEFSRRYPKVSIKLLEASSGELMDKLSKGEIDLILDNKNMDEEIFSSRYLCSEHLLLAVPEAFVKNGKSAFSAKDICMDAHLSNAAKTTDPIIFKDAPFLFQKPGNDTRERESMICRLSGFEPDIRFELDQQSTAYNLSSAGLGISFVGDLLVKWDPRTELKFFSLSGSHAVRDINFFYKKSRTLSKAARSFLELARSV